MSIESNFHFLPQNVKKIRKKIICDQLNQLSSNIQYPLLVHLRSKSIISVPPYSVIQLKGNIHRNPKEMGGGKKDKSFSFFLLSNFVRLIQIWILLRSQPTQPSSHVYLVFILYLRNCRMDGREREDEEKAVFFPSV